LTLVFSDISQVLQKGLVARAKFSFDGRGEVEIEKQESFRFYPGL